ncbi:unnamed protein product [Spirodela intermedia]|uniref:Uncharacterized protein n=1 Tax=Spirodela intermedia TaxID=51605 RepID=A0A7I8J3Z6_SPIIN|nr:unnamed protein product [Spirodela intermedia]CAA6664810.1 unnamed protein product [Spirodela intermedia]
MVIVTGDRYLDSLVRFVERNAEPLLEGALTLKLNPVGLHYVQSRLEALEELERLLAGAPVDYLRAYQLRRILRLLTSLKVISVLAPPARDPTPLSLLPFGRLKVLELRGCDLSSSTARGLLELRHTLEKLICHNSTDALRHVFASRLVDIRDSPTWNRLSFVSCACNGLVLMDESLQLLPVVETLDLSRNHFAKVDNLRKCTKLFHLDLGFNHLRTVASLSEVLCPIVKLVLRNNALTTLRGIENLKSVEGLDLSYNILSNFSELEILASLPLLHSVWLEGNPICCARWYRAHYFSLFPALKNRREYWERHVIIAGRRKRPAGYGFYFPAKENAGGRDRVNAKKKKVSRLASIRDEKQMRYFCGEDADQESASCDTDNLKDENVIIDDESEIKGLMNRVEFMKKEQAVLWLRDFREWMDQTVDGTANLGKFSDSNMCFDMGRDTKQTKCEKHLGKRPLHLMDILQTSKGEGSITILETDVPSTVGQKLVDFHERDSLKQSVGSRIGFRTGKTDPGNVQLEACYEEVPDSVCVEKNSPSFTNLTIEVNEDTERHNNLVSLTSIEEIIFSRQSSLCPVSPPHYQEDILHRRQNLEEEFLQLSAETFSVTSSDSDTSSSDGDSWEFCDSCLEHSQLFNKESMKRIISDNVSDFQLNENSSDVVQEGVRLSYNAPVETDASSQRPLMSNHGKPFLIHDLDDSSTAEIINQGLGTEEKANGRLREWEVVVLLSTKQKVYVLLIDETCEGPGLISKVLGCYRREEIKEVVIGLELQALRVRIEGDVSHIFLARSAKKLERLLYLLHVCDTSGPNSGCSHKRVNVLVVAAPKTNNLLKSYTQNRFFNFWEQVQVELFDKYICGGLKLSIFLYAMLLFYHDGYEGESWLSRSLFLVEGYLLLCIENLVEFGKSTDDFAAPTSYFSLHSCFPIENITEMGNQMLDPGCEEQHHQRRKAGPLSAEESLHLPRWRLKWFSEEALLSFVALLKALHAELSTAPLRVMCRTS